jgi:hypothetical protein
MNIFTQKAKLTLLHLVRSKIFEYLSSYFEYRSKKKTLRHRWMFSNPDAFQKIQVIFLARK